MARAAFNVLILLYKKEMEEIEYCIFKRADGKIWQFLAGGGEDKETPIEAAERETLEEANIKANKLCKLTSMCFVPANQFSEAAQMSWGTETCVIPVYCFASKVDQELEIQISEEHLEYKWCTYEEAQELLYFDLDKTALYELKEKVYHRVI